MERPFHESECVQARVDSNHVLEPLTCANSGLPPNASCSAPLHESERLLGSFVPEGGTDRTLPTEVVERPRPGSDAWPNFPALQPLATVKVESFQTTSDACIAVLECPRHAFARAQHKLMTMGSCADTCVCQREPRNDEFAGGLLL